MGARTTTVIISVLSSFLEFSGRPDFAKSFLALAVWMPFGSCYQTNSAEATKRDEVLAWLSSGVKCK